MPAHSDMIVAGIDPGKGGAMSINFPDGAILVYDVPLVEKNKKTVPAWSEWKRTWRYALEFAGPDLVVIEDVSARPGQGVTSMFSFGRTLGFVHGLIPIDTRIEFVSPAVWKPKMGLANAGKGLAREKARTMFPRYACHYARVKDDGRAEAALIAEYGRKHL